MNEASRFSVLVPPLLRIAPVVTALVLALASGACRLSTIEVATGSSGGSDLYPKLPNRATSTLYRAALKTIPYTSERAFHGHYGGCGNEGGEPEDTMDELFRRHDIVYGHTRCHRTMVSADLALVRSLRAVDPSALTPRAAEYRQRAIAFFQSRASRLLGKPVSSFLWLREPGGSPFTSDEAIEAFFAVPAEVRPAVSIVRQSIELRIRPQAERWQRPSGKPRGRRR